MKTIADLLKEHSLFEGLSEEHLQFIAGCGKNVVFSEGQVIANPGDPADEFYLIREGHLSLTLDVPPKKPFVFQTLGKGDLVGLSWLIPPYLWYVSVQALKPTRAIAFDGKCIRKKCEEDHHLGFELMKRLISILVVREEAFRLHLLDIYGDHK